MNRNEAVEQIKMEVLGFKQGTAFDATIVTAIQQSQVELEEEEELPWFLKRHYSGLATVANQQDLSVPAGFIREYSEDQLFAVDSENGVHSVVKDFEGELRLLTPTTGVPKNYAIVNGVFYFYPIPDKVYTLKGTFFKKADILTNGTDTNDWLTHLPEILWSKAAFRIASGLRDQTGMQLAAGILGRATQKLNNKNTVDEASGSKPVIGGAD